MVTGSGRKVGYEGKVDQVAEDDGEEGLEEVHHHRWFRHRHARFMVAQAGDSGRRVVVVSTRGAGGPATAGREAGATAHGDWRYGPSAPVNILFYFCHSQAIRSCWNCPRRCSM